jgi:hypothetical protein
MAKPEQKYPEERLFLLDHALRSGSFNTLLLIPPVIIKTISSTIDTGNCSFAQLKSLE